MFQGVHASGVGEVRDVNSDSASPDIRGLMSSGLRLWSEPQVDRWYAQNLLLFSRGRQFEPLAPFPLDIVHPREYERARRPPSTREVASELRQRVVDAGLRRLRLR